MGGGAPCTPQTLPSPRARARLPWVHLEPATTSPQPKQKPFRAHLPRGLPAGRSWSVPAHMHPGSSPICSGGKAAPSIPSLPARALGQLQPSHAAVRAAQGESGSGKAIAWAAPACPTFLLNIAGQVLPIHPPEPARERLSTCLPLPWSSLPRPKILRPVLPVPLSPLRRPLAAAAEQSQSAGRTQVAAGTHFPPHGEPTQK